MQFDKLHVCIRTAISNFYKNFGFTFACNFFTFARNLGFFYVINESKVR